MGAFKCLFEKHPVCIRKFGCARKPTDLYTKPTANHQLGVPWLVDDEEVTKMSEASGSLDGLDDNNEKSTEAGLTRFLPSASEIDAVAKLKEEGNELYKARKWYGPCLSVSFSYVLQDHPAAGHSCQRQNPESSRTQADKKLRMLNRRRLFG